MAIETELMLAGAMIGSSIAFAATIFYQQILVKKMWPIRTPLAIQRGKTGVVWDLDERGKIVRKKSGYEALRLRKKRQNIRSPKYEELTVGENGKPIYPLYNTISGQFFPTKMEGLSKNAQEKYKKYYDDNGELIVKDERLFVPIKLMNPPRMEVVEDKSAKNWAIQELERVHKTYTESESMFLKYAPYIMNATFAAMVIFFVIYFGGKIEIAGNALSGAASTLTNAINRFVPSGGAPTPPPITTTIPVR